MPASGATVRRPDGIVIGVPSWQEAATIGAHTRRIDEALSSAGFGREAVIVNADNASPDGTAEVFLAAPTRHRKCSLITARGKGSNEAAMFEFALHAGAEVFVTLDADLEVLPHDWLPALAGPVLSGAADLVIPLYRRFWYDGTITNQVVAPLVLGVTGQPIRQPIGGDYAFSAKALRLLSGRPWPEAALGFGWDIHMVALALQLGLVHRQAELSYGKVHSWRGDSPAEIDQDMRRKIAEVVTATFDGLAVLPVAATDELHPFPAAPPAGRSPKDYDLRPAEELTSGYWHRERDSPWTRRLLEGIAPIGDDGYPVLDDQRWAMMLARAFRPTPSPELLAALHALYFVRQIQVLPQYRELAPDKVDARVYELAAHLRHALLDRSGG